MRPNAPPEGSQGGALPRRRVLIVDDEPSSNTLAGEYLRLSGFEVVERFDAESALELLRRDAAFDAIVLDKRLPGMDGLEALRALKEDPKLSSIPVIMLSASAPTEAIADAGAAGFIPKPFSPKDLAAAIKKLLP